MTCDLDRVCHGRAPSPPNGPAPRTACDPGSWRLCSHGGGRPIALAGERVGGQAGERAMPSPSPRALRLDLYPPVRRGRPRCERTTAAALSGTTRLSAVTTVDLIPLQLQTGRCVPSSSTLPQGHPVGVATDADPSEGADGRGALPVADGSGHARGDTGL